MLFLDEYNNYCKIVEQEEHKKSLFLIFIAYRQNKIGNKIGRT